MPKIDRVEVLDYSALGKMIIKWTKNVNSRPKDLSEFEKQLKGIVKFPLPKWIKGLQFVQGSRDVLLIRLPPVELMEDTRASVAGDEPYPLPKSLEEFYLSLADKGLPQTKSAKRAMLHTRVADYTIQCCA